MKEVDRQTTTSMKKGGRLFFGKSSCTSNVLRRSTRLREKFQFKFTSKEPITVSDDEENEEENAGVVAEDDFPRVEVELPKVEVHLPREDEDLPLIVTTNRNNDEKSDLNVDENNGMFEETNDDDVLLLEGEDTEFREFVSGTETVFEGDDNKEEFQSDNLEMHDKMRWKTMKDCRVFLRKYAISKKFEYKQKKNDKLKIKFVCKDPKCKWRIYVRKVPNEHTALLRSYMGKHTCKSDEKGKNSLANAGWVADQIEDCMRNHKEFRPKDVQSEIWKKFGVKVAYFTAYNARIIYHERIYGKYDEGYKKCPAAPSTPLGAECKQCYL